MDLERTYHGRPLHHAWFAPLAAHWAQAACGQGIPLTLHRDRLEGEDHANRHHDFLSLYVVRQGCGEHVIDGVSYGVARGDVYAMGLGQTHYFSRCRGLETDTLHFAPSVFDPATLDILTQTPGFYSLFVEEPQRRREQGGAEGRWLHLTPDSHALVDAMLAELSMEWAAGTPAGTLLTRALFLRLLVHLARAYAAGSGRAPSVPAQEATVAAAVRYLDAHFTEPLRITDIAASVFLSPDRFTEVFSQGMGRTPRDYLSYLRLERAKALLRTTDQPVAAIGLEAGFGDAAYFTRAFRAATGQTPSAFRRQERRE